MRNLSISFFGCTDRLYPAILAALVIIAVSGTSGMGAYVDVVDGLGPVGYWRLGESEGTTASDRSGNNLNGTYDGVALGLTGALGGDSDTAADFDGTDDQIISAASNILRLTGDMSVIFWVNIDTFPGASATDPLFVIEADAQSAGKAKMAELTVNQSGDLTYTHEYGESGSGFEQKLFSSANLDTDTWYNIAVTRDSTAEEVIVYINGSYLDTFSYNNQAEGYGNGELYLGKYGTDLFDGSMDEIAVFDYELTSTNISDIYNAGVPEPSTLVLLGIGGLALVCRRRK